jgi:hypothetical protein
MMDLNTLGHVTFPPNLGFVFSLARHIYIRHEESYSAPSRGIVFWIFTLPEMQFSLCS